MRPMGIHARCQPVRTRYRRRCSASEKGHRPVEVHIGPSTQSGDPRSCYFACFSFFFFCFSAVVSFGLFVLICFCWPLGIVFLGLGEGAERTYRARRRAVVKFARSQGSNVSPASRSENRVWACVGSTWVADTKQCNGLENIAEKLKLAFQHRTAESVFGTRVR